MGSRNSKDSAGPYALLLAVTLGIAIVGYAGYVLYARFDLPSVTGASLLLLAAAAGIASFFSPVGLSGPRPARALAAYSLNESSDRCSILGTPFGVREDDVAVCPYDEVPSQLATVLAQMQIGHLATGDHLGVSRNDPGVEIRPDERRTAEVERPIGRAIWIQYRLEWEFHPLVKLEDTLSWFERYNKDFRILRLEKIFLVCHLHEMALAKKSTDISQECQDDRRSEK